MMKMFKQARYFLGFLSVCVPSFLLLSHHRELSLLMRSGDGLHNVQRHFGSGSRGFKQAGIHIAIGGGITGHGVKKLNATTIHTLDFFTTFLPSLCKTIDKKYHYHLYWGYDYDDPFYLYEENRTAFRVETAKFVRENCPGGVEIPVVLIKCDHNGSPAWAQNDGMFAAYLDGADYFYRINDDTMLNTSKWAEIFIGVLRNRNPPNVGVVGPTTNVKTHMLTYDFTHKSHQEILGYYYPRKLPKWYADFWIDKFYKMAGKRDKLSNVTLLHTQAKGKRYPFNRDDSKYLPGECKCALSLLNRYLNRVVNKIAVPTVSASTKNVRVISMSLYGDKLKYTTGAVRNTQLIPVIFPGWRIRFYTPPQSSPLAVPNNVINKLLELGAEIITVYDLTLRAPDNWKYLAAFDESVDTFLIRDADFRLSDREKEVIDLWMNSAKIVNVIKDLPLHDIAPIPTGLWGAQRKSFINNLSNLVSSTGDNFKDMIAKATTSLIDRFIYSSFHEDMLCMALDKSVAREECAFVQVKTPLMTNCGNVRVGQRYEAFDKLIESEQQAET